MTSAPEERIATGVLRKLILLNPTLGSTLKDVINLLITEIDNMKIYPEFEKMEFKAAASAPWVPSLIELKTLVRKQHTDGLWYFVRVATQFEYDPSIPPLHRVGSMNQELDLFLREVYKAILFHVVDPDLRRDRDGTLVYTVDPDQRDERERLKIL